MLQDIRFSLWMLVKNPGFTVVSLLSLAIAIAANTAIFSFLDAVLLKPLAHKDSDRLAMVWELSSNGTKTIPSPPTFLEWRAQNQVFTHLAAITSGDNLNLTGRDRAERIRCSSVSANYFEMLGVNPMIGRTFSPVEDQFGNEHVAVLANRFWSQKLGADSKIIGTTILLNNENYVVIGVLSASEIFDKEVADVWIPLAFKPEQLNPNARFFSVIGKLRPGVTIDQAGADMKRIAEGLRQKNRIPDGSYSAVVQPLRNHIVGNSTKTILFLLMGAACFILLIACSNLANLLLARAAFRKREIAIRLALGASQYRLFRQFLTESLIIAIISGGLGIILANWLVKAFIVLMPSLTLPIEIEVSLDWRALLFTVGISCLAGILFGLVPAWQSMKLDLTKPLQERSVGATSRLRRNKSRSLLLVLQITLSFMLTIGAALMVRSFVRLTQVELGFETDNVITLRTNLDQVRYPQSNHILTYQSELLGKVRALPGVISAAATNALPLGGSSIKNVIQIPSQKANGSVIRESTATRIVSHDYFSTLGLHLIKGRFFSEQDTAQSPSVLIINQTLANRLQIENSPIGAQVQFMGEKFAQLTFTIVGVVGDTRHKGPSSQSESESYIPLAQTPEKILSSQGRSPFFVVKTAIPPAALITTIQPLAASVDRDQPVYNVRTMEQMYSESIAQPRFLTSLFSLFGILALILAIIGIYGVMAYSVSQRTHEIGIRIALGASTNNVLGLVMGQALLLALAGITIGLVAALALSRYLSSLLYEVKSTDAATYAGVALLLTGVALLASYFPARTATKVDPLVALRHE